MPGYIYGISPYQTSRGILLGEEGGGAGGVEAEGYGAVGVGAGIVEEEAVAVEHGAVVVQLGVVRAFGHAVADYGGSVRQLAESEVAACESCEELGFRLHGHDAAQVGPVRE